MEIIDTTTGLNPTTSESAPTETDIKLNIAECLESILNFVSKDRSTPPFRRIKKVENGPRPDKAYDYACSALDITPTQAELLAIIMELSIGSTASNSRIAETLGCTNLKFISLRKEIDELCSKRYVRPYSNRMSGPCYRVPDEVVKCIQNNKKPNGEDISGLTTSGILKALNTNFRKRIREEIDRDTLDMEIRDILNYNLESSFIQECIKYGINKVPMGEQVLFFYMLCKFFFEGETEFGWLDIMDVFDDGYDEYDIKRGLEGGTLSLFNNKLIENAIVDGMVDNEQITFAQGVTDKILADLKVKKRGAPKSRRLINNDQITEKKLYFNKSERYQIETFSNLLLNDNYENIISRLKEKGMRSGFCALFYGGPGTGKTESVYQIAKKTGRNIFLVDVSRIKSKWVGDSEKNIKALFDEYRSIVNNSEVAPILLFNEADAILSIRKSGAENAVDKMENSIQNIILQEMENLQGIMIATTNLTQNFDSAFERRFIYKLEFNKPDIQSRISIWESMMEGIDPEYAKALAEEFEFSGGQIENISRKATVDYILSGEQPDLNHLRELCKNETIGSGAKNARIGF